MVKHTLRINRPALHGVGIDNGKKLVGRVLRRTLNRSAVLCPVDFGNLRSTGGIKAATDMGGIIRGEVEYTANYAAAVHNGRRALTIRARRKKSLRFTVDGRVVFARQVHQPARKGRPFLTRALREVARQTGFRVTIG